MIALKSSAIFWASSSSPNNLFKLYDSLLNESVVLYILSLNCGSPMNEFKLYDNWLKSVVALSIITISWFISPLESSIKSLSFVIVTLVWPVKELIFWTDIFNSAITWSDSKSLIFLLVSVNDSAALYCQSIKSAILIGSTIV